MAPSTLPERIRLMDGNVCLRTGQIHRSGHDATLTTMELRALQWMVSHADEDVSHEDLLVHVWSYAPGIDSRAPYFTMRRLRSKLEKEPSKPTVLLTIHGVGYRYSPPLNAALPPPPRPLPQSNLPRPTPLVGREQSITLLCQAIDSQGWVTLYGPPGVGKTALAIAVAERTGGEAWMCHLSGSDDAQAAAQSVAELLGRRPAAGDPTEVIDAAGEMLAGRGGIVLVLDDISPTAVTLLRQAWQARAPRLRVLACHRRRPVHGGHLVEPLTPADGAAMLRACTAHVAASGTWREADLRALSARLDGLPMALALVAPRLRLLSPARLMQRKGILSQGALLELISDAWRASDGPSQGMLMACSAFVGGCSLDDLVEVSLLEEDQALDTLEDLTDRCLIRVVDRLNPSGEPRFFVFAPVRDFVASQVGFEAAQSRQSRCLVRACRTLQRTLRDGHAEAYALLALESANLHGALLVPETELEVRLVMDALLRASGTPVDRLHNADRAVALATSRGEPALLSEAYLARVSGARGTPQADLADFSRAMVAATSLEQQARISLAHAQHFLVRGRPLDAIPILSTARADAAQGDNPVLLHAVLQSCLHSAVDRADLGAAEALAADILAHRRAFSLEALPLQNLVVWYDISGQAAEMEAALLRDIAAHKRRGERDREANALMNIGFLRMHQLDPQAEEQLQQAVALARSAGNRQVESVARYNLACLYLSDERIAEGVVEVRAARALADIIGNLRQQAFCALGLGQQEVARSGPGARAALEEAIGLAERCGDPSIAALARMLLVTVLHESGDPDQAARSWGELNAWLEESRLAERLSLAQRYHGALYALVQGSPVPLNEVLSSPPADSFPKRLLCAWARQRR